MRNWPAGRARNMPRVGSRLGLDEAEAARARGVDVLRTSGTPHTPPPAHVLEAASRAALENGTAPSQGLPALRGAIADKLRRDNGVAVDAATEVLVTRGAQQALFLGVLALVEPGDEIIVPTPAYFVDGVVAMSGAEPRYVPLDPSTGYALDADRLAAAVTSRTKLVLLFNPGNPGGHVATGEELSALARLARDRDLFVIADESYERIVYDGRVHVSLASLPATEGRVLTVHSCSKTYALAGWRVGYAAGPAPVIAEMRKLLEWCELGGDYVSQHAALAALEGPQAWTFAIRDMFARNRDGLVAALEEAPGLRFVVPQGNPNLFLDVSRSGRSAPDVARWLLERHGIRTTPGEYFQAPGYVRLEFGGPAEVVAETGRRLAAAARELFEAT